MKFNSGLLTLSLFILVSYGSGQTQPENSTALITGNKISGAWRINYAESDNPFLKMQTLLQNKLEANEKNINAKEETLPTMSVSLVPPETLILVGDDEKSITINEGFNEIIFTRTISTDGKTRNGELQNGAMFLLSALQNAGILKIETISPRGNKLIENYVVSNEGRKLIVTLRFENSETKEIMTLRRVYDRTTLDIFPSNSEEIQ